MSNVHSTVKQFRKNLSGVADEIGESADATGKNARSGFFGTLEKMGRAYTALRGFDTDSLLAEIGLERRRSALQSVFVFSSGFALGAGTALLFAPTSGQELRRRIGKAVADFVGPDVVDKAEHIVKDARTSVGNAVRGAKDTIEHAVRGSRDPGGEARSDLSDPSKAKPESQVNKGPFS